MAVNSNSQSVRWRHDWYA